MVFLHKPNNFLYLTVSKRAFFCNFDLRFQPNLAQILSTFLANMDMGPVLIIISIVEQEYPHYLLDNIYKDFWHIQQFVIFFAKMRRKSYFSKNNNQCWGTALLKAAKSSGVPC